MSASHDTLSAFTDAASDAIARAIAMLQREADRAEQLRAAEHRAFMAESREALAVLKRDVEQRLATVRDGVDGKDGRDGADGAPGAAGPAGECGADGAEGPQGVPGEPGERGADGQDGLAGRDGLDGQNGADGQDGAPGRDGTDGAAGRDGADGKDGIDGAPGRDGADADLTAPLAVLEEASAEYRAAVDALIARGDERIAALRDGADGADGRDGRDGADAYPGEARGLYDPEASYRAMDTVSLNGSEWRARTDAPGVLPGPGWMLSAKRGSRGQEGERGREGPAGPAGNSAPGIIAGYVERGSTDMILTRDDGSELRIDLYDLATMIRSA